MTTASYLMELDQVCVTEGQGVGEGDFELQIQVLEATPVGYVERAIWPSINRTEKVNNNGDPKKIGNQWKQTYYTAGERKFVVTAVEEDTGTLGKDEFGQQSVVFDFQPNMGKYLKTATIGLSNKTRHRGEIKVTLTAQGC